MAKVPITKPPTPPDDSNNTTTESRQSKKQIGTVAIESIRNIVEIIKPYELSERQRLQTYQQMLLDDAVATPYFYSCILVEKAFSKYTIEHDKNSPSSVVAADFLEYNLENMNMSSIRQVVRDAIEFKRDGLSILEKNFRKEKEGDWEGFWTIDKLPQIPNLSLRNHNPFKITNDGRVVTEVRQRKSAFKNSDETIKVYNKGTTRNVDYIPIPRNKVMFFTTSGTSSQPFGTSLFDAAYTAWREKVLLQDYTLVGVTKDFSGTPILKVPGEILAEADADPSSQAGRMVQQLKDNLATMHAGDQAYTILPSDTYNDAGTGVGMFEMKFMGVEGGGKSFDSESLVEQRKRAIYSCFGASHLIMGENGGGSYNLHEGQAITHSHYIERDIAVIEEVLNKDLVKQLFRLNGWELYYKDLPKIKAGDIQPLSLDETSKAAQRVGAVGLLPSRDPKFLNELYKNLGYEYRFKDDATSEEVDELTGQDVSRSGDGMSAGMPSGVGKATGGGDTSSTNNENNA